MDPAAVASAVRAAVQAAVDSGALAVAVPAEVPLEAPRDPAHGDYASSVALRLAKAAGRPPRAVAETIATHLRTAEGVAAVEVAGPGFLNLRLAPDALGTLARTVVGAGSRYGESAELAGLAVNLEFVSANPTGPVHLGGVRWAAVGDAMGRLLTATGARVTREYYVNDAGNQVDLYAASLLARARGAEVPADGYRGDDVAVRAREVLAAEPALLDLPEDKALEVFRREGLQAVLADIRRSLADFGVHFDVWFSEASLRTSGAVDRALTRLRDQGRVYEADGAVWLRTTDFGDDKDRVLVKSDGETTYFTSDCAYYLDKRERGADKVVILLGADHHGYVGRMRAMAACFGDDPAQTLELPIGQLVNLVRDGQPVKMSKRAGEVLTLDDVVALLGVDAARYALARSSADSVIDLDVDLLTRQASENPVFYVQYAATRCASILRHAAELGIDTTAAALDRADVGLLSHPLETAVLKALGEFPRVVAGAAQLREPHRVARYLEEALAPAAQRWFDAKTECRALPQGDEDVRPVHRARLLLWRATRVVCENALDLLGVTAPERM